MSNFVKNALFPVFPTQSPLWAVPIHLEKVNFFKFTEIFFP